MSLPVLISLSITYIISSQMLLQGILEVLVTGILFSVLFILFMWIMGMNRLEKDLLIGLIVNIKNKLKV